MNQLAERSCRPCRQDSLPVAADERERLLKEIPDWRIECVDGMDQLVGNFSFPDFGAALKFVNHVGELAEAADHHPRIVLEWGAGEVRWWTHAIGDLHENDFILAARTSQVHRRRRP